MGDNSLCLSLEASEVLVSPHDKLGGANVEVSLKNEDPSPLKMFGLSKPSGRRRISTSSWIRHLANKDERSLGEYPTSIGSFCPSL